MTHCLIHHENTVKQSARDRLYTDFPAGYHLLGGLLCRFCPAADDPQTGGHGANSFSKGTPMTYVIALPCVDFKDRACFK